MPDSTICSTPWPKKLIDSSTIRFRQSNSHSKSRHSEIFNERWKMRRKRNRRSWGSDRPTLSIDTFLSSIRGRNSSASSPKSKKRAKSNWWERHGQNSKGIWFKCCWWRWRKKNKTWKSKGTTSKNFNPTSSSDRKPNCWKQSSWRRQSLEWWGNIQCINRLEKFKGLRNLKPIIISGGSPCTNSSKPAKKAKTKQIKESPQ